MSDEFNKKLKDILAQLQQLCDEESIDFACPSSGYLDIYGHTIPAEVSITWWYPSRQEC
jgi:hypothetical protein